MKSEIELPEEFEPPSLRPAMPLTENAGHCIAPAVFPRLLKRPRQKTYHIPGFPESELARAFRERFFPDIGPQEWSDWQWQVQHRYTSIRRLRSVVRLTEEESSAETGGVRLPLAITPYYASLIDPSDPAQAIRRSVVPSRAECMQSPGEAADPLGEECDSPVKGLVHRYPDRVLFLATDFCSTYCRYCTRSRMVGHRNGSGAPVSRWEEAIAYIERTTTIRDVLVSGGDPLTMPDERLKWLLGRLRRIRHVEIIRIGTKVPAVLPQRVTPALTRMLRQFHPIWMSIHFTHPAELTPETACACERLADAGIPLGSQTVLLQGINDRLETMRDLFHGLLRMRVRPYYLYQCDPILGSSHFRTPVEKGLEIIAGLRGHTTGYAVPTYVIDAPGGGGKIPLLPETVVGWDSGDLLLRNYQSQVFRYPGTSGYPACEISSKEG